VRNHIHLSRNKTVSSFYAPTPITSSALARDLEKSISLAFRKRLR
jgi:hypothetical protein